jgi:hypothetical protein
VLCSRLLQSSAQCAGVRPLPAWFKRMLFPMHITWGGLLVFSLEGASRPHTAGHLSTFSAWGVTSDMPHLLGPAEYGHIMCPRFKSPRLQVHASMSSLQACILHKWRASV